MDISVHATLAMGAHIFTIPHFKRFVHMSAERTELSSRDESIENYNFDEILKALGKENAEKAVTTDKNSWGVHYALDQIELNNKTLDANDIANTIRNYVQIISEYVNKLNNK